MTVFQFTYTTLFGFHSAFLLLRTGSLLPSISAHIFCNFMGIPQLQDELRRYSHRRRRKLNVGLVSSFNWFVRIQRLCLLILLGSRFIYTEWGLGFLRQDGLRHVPDERLSLGFNFTLMYSNELRVIDQNIYDCIHHWQREIGVFKEGTFNAFSFNSTSSS